MRGEARGPLWSRLLWFGPPFLIGALLRLWNLPAQVMSDDEFHLVHVVLGDPLARILTTYHLVDNSIPLSALFRLAIDAGVRPSEMAFRLPALLCGLAVLALFPAWADRRLGRGTAVVFAWLLALSPGLVWYSRIARSYAPIVLLGSAAAVAFFSWWRQPRLGMGATYVACAALAAWFHLGAAPFVVAPFAFAAGDLALADDRRRWRSLAGLAAATCAAFLAFLLPTWPSLLALVRDKHIPLQLSPALGRDVAELAAGSGRPVVAALFWLLAAGGLAVLGLARRTADRRLAAYSATLVAGHLAGLLILAPVGHQYPMILNRYLLIALPVVLLWVACALGHPLAPPRRPAWRAALAAAFLVLLALAGPFTDPYLRASPLAHHDDYLSFYTPRPQPGPAQMSGFYRWLAGTRSPRPGAVLEYPWMPMWRTNRAFYFFQEVHGRDVVVAPPRPLLWDRRLALRNLAPGNPEGFLASRARFLVVHRDLGAEEDAIPDLYRPDIKPRFRQVFRRFGGAMGDRLEREWGPPDYADRRLRAWDLERVRRARRRPPLPPAAPAAQGTQ